MAPRRRQGWWVCTYVCWKEEEEEGKVVRTGTGGLAAAGAGDGGRPRFLVMSVCCWCGWVGWGGWVGCCWEGREEVKQSFQSKLALYFHPPPPTPVPTHPPTSTP